MKESLFNAQEELKHLEHTIYVTLKYTRTVDIIRNALNKLISIFDFIIEALLEDAREKALIQEIPKSPSLKSRLVVRAYPDDKKLLKFGLFYAFLRDLLHAKQSKREEYRRHVALIANLKNRTAELDIDSLETYEAVAEQFFDYAQELIEGKKEEE